MNKVILIGNLTKDVDLRYTQSQKAVARFTIAVNRNEDNADFIRVTCWDKQAENIERYCHKGSKVAIEGRISTGSYVGESGETVYTTDIVADRVEFLGGNNGQQ